MTRLSIPRALTVVAAVVAAGFVAALPAASQTGTAQITVKVRPTAKVVDLLGKGFSAGDIVLSRGRAADPTSGEIVGFLTLRCQRTKMASDKTWAWLLCDGELRTDDGKVTFAGTRRQGEAYPNGEFAITGGTGNYASASGVVTTEDDAARNTWTFDIIA